MIPFIVPGALKAIGGFLSKLPREFWYALAVAAFFLWLRAHWINAGFERCQEAHKAAYEKAQQESAKQAKAAPAIAQKAADEVKPVVQERIKVIREKVPVSVDCPAYGDGVQSVIREARSTAATVR